MQNGNNDPRKPRIKMTQARGGVAISAKLRRLDLAMLHHIIEFYKQEVRMFPSISVVFRRLIVAHMRYIDSLISTKEEGRSIEGDILSERGELFQATLNHDGDDELAAALPPLDPNTAQSLPTFRARTAPIREKRAEESRKAIQDWLSGSSAPDTECPDEF